MNQKNQYFIFIIIVLLLLIILLPYKKNSIEYVAKQIK